MRTGADGTTVYLPGGQEVTIDGTTVTAARYYSFGGMTVATRTGNGLGAVTTLVSDRDGSVIAAVPNTEWTTASLTRVYTDPFGNIRGGSDTGVPGDHRFLGATRDADSGLTLLGARYYDPVIGRFVSVDPVLNLNVPAHLNGYAYGYNNPTTFSDPSGATPSRSRSDAPTGTTRSGTSGTSSTSPTASPPNTSWAALDACTDVWCSTGWQLQFQAHVLGGVFETLGLLVWEACNTCQIAVDIPSMVSNWDGYWAQKQADTASFLMFATSPGALGKMWDGFWQPIGEDWANNPGHALGGAAATLASFLVPGGAALKASGLVSKADRLIDNTGGVALSLHYKDGWTPAQIAAADQKVAALNNSDQLVVTQSQRGGTSAASTYSSNGGLIPSGSDVDHVVDLQLGGSNSLSNLSPLDASVNRSLGAQIASQIRGLDPGTVICSVTICSK